MFRLLHRRLLCAAVASPAAQSSSASSTTAPPAAANVDELTPKKIVELLNTHIVGQDKAKKAVAVALRNRWRRKLVDDKGLRDDITPKNILMIGPTGVGKSEIARRMARITNAPFIKVEATKYTEVGIKGKDVDSIIEDLYANARTKARQALEKERDDEAEGMARDFVYTYLSRNVESFRTDVSMEAFIEKVNSKDTTFLHAHTITMAVTQQETESEAAAKAARGPIIIIGFPGGDISKRTTTVTVKIDEALTLAKKEALLKLIDDTQVAGKAKVLCEEEGIVVIDEIDKIVADPNIVSSGSSDEAVQQDLLPIVEGSTITMKDGTTIETQGILFICCGAFHMVKPSDMIAELQGRLPVRVDLQPMTVTELRRILTEPKFNILRQQEALLKVDDIRIKFDESGIDAIAEVSAKVNKQSQNTGARRLSTVVERVLDEVSFDVEKYKGQEEVIIDANFVKEKTSSMVYNIDLAKYLL